MAYYDFRKTKNFVAVDFETFTALHTSACAIGLVKVINGVISQKFYSLIHPIPDDKKTNNSMIHGITSEMLADAPLFFELFPAIVDFVGNLPIVCHNSDTDIRIFDECMKFFDLEGLKLENHICTYKITGKSLSDCCNEFGIQQGHHHDALDDATACANVYLAIQGIAPVHTFMGGMRNVMKLRDGKKYDRATLDKLDDSLVENKDTIFYNASVVITGTFSAYPNRNELGKRIQALGADINTSISRKTTVVVMGEGAGPSKVKKIDELKDNGQAITIIREHELIEILG